MRLPWLNYLLVNAPDDYYGGFSWYDITGNHAPGVLRSRKLLFDLLDDLRARGYPTEQTTLGGFSQGCLMAIDVALRYPHRLAGRRRHQRLCFRAGQSPAGTFAGGAGTAFSRHARDV